MVIHRRTLQGISAVVHQRCYLIFRTFTCSVNPVCHCTSDPTPQGRQTPPLPRHPRLCCRFICYRVLDTLLPKLVDSRKSTCRVATLVSVSAAVFQRRPDVTIKKTQTRTQRIHMNDPLDDVLQRTAAVSMLVACSHLPL